MNVIRPFVAVLIAMSAYVLWRSQDAGQSSGDLITETTDTLSEAVTTYLGIDMFSARYAAALNDPKNAAIIGLLQAAESRNEIPSGLLVRQAWQESRFNPNAVNKSSGAQGLMQFMPATAAEWGVNVFDAASAADGAGRYMAWLYRKLGSWSLALAGYNWGIGNVMRKGMDAAPTETQNYVSQINADVLWS